MRKVFDKLHHHGKKVYRHAQKHHKKYFWGAAGFFGLFKMFTFLIVSMSGYLATNAELAQPINIEIPGTIISQTNGEVLKFDISGIDLKTAQSIAFQMPLDASGNTVDSYLSTETKPNEKYMYTLNKGENDIWAMQTKDIGIVKDQIGSGDASIYLQTSSAFLKTDIAGTESIFKLIIGQGDANQTESPPPNDSTDISGSQISLLLPELMDFNMINGETSNKQIIENLYGLQSNYTLNRNQKICETKKMKVVHIDSGEDTLPEYLSGNTVYVLGQGEYITDYIIKITDDCTAIVGENTQVNLFDSKTRGATIKIVSGSNTIISNLNIYGTQDGSRFIHEANNYGIYVTTSNNTIDNIQAYDYVGFAVYLEDFNNQTNNITLYKQLNLGNIQKQENTGDIQIVQNTGNVQVIQNTGDIQVVDKSGNIQNQDNSGDIQVIQNTGDIQVLDNSGNIQNQNNSGDIQVIQNTGDIQVVDTSGNIQNQDNSGDIPIPKSTGDIQVLDNSGNINVIPIMNPVNRPIVLQNTKGKIGRGNIMNIEGFTLENSVFTTTRPLDLGQSQGRITDTIELRSIDGEIKVHITPNIIIKRSKGGREYTGIIMSPKEISVSSLTGEIPLRHIDKAFKIGSDTEGVNLRDSKGNTVNAMVQMAVSGYQKGDRISIAYSQNGEQRGKMGTTEVKSLNGNTYIEFQTNHFTTFAVGPRTYDFFFGTKNSNCGVQTRENFYDDNIKSTALACISAEDFHRIDNITIMRFSMIDENDLTKNQSTLSFENDHPLFIPDDKPGDITVYAQYGYLDGNKEMRGDIVTGDIMVTKSGDFSFFIGDSKKCDKQLTETNSDKSIKGYICIGGKDIGNISNMRLANFGMDDLIGQNRVKLANGTGWDIPEDISGGNQMLYMQYQYGEKTYWSQVVGYSIKINKISIGKTQVAPDIVYQDDHFDVTNMYQTIKSTDGVSFVKINTTDTESGTAITVSNDDWDGTISPPTEITDGSLKANQGEPGLPTNFVPQQTIQVGAANIADLELNTGQFTVSFKVTNPLIEANKTINIYSSHDGTNRSQKTTCNVILSGDIKTCTFTTSHLSLFTIGTTGIPGGANNNILWNNMDFVNARFRGTNPNTGNVIDAFFGTGGSGSAYTTIRSTGCRPTSMIVRNPGTMGATGLTTNTIYVLNGGNYTRNGMVTMANCSAIVGSGDVFIKSNLAGSPGIYGLNITGAIIDNITFSGSNGIYFYTGTNITLNDVQIYKTNFGLYGNVGNNFLLNNSQLYDNSNYSIFYNFINNAVINNSQNYNNGAYGSIYIRANSGVVINNTLSYNNNAPGIYVYQTTGLIINNSESYNNKTYGLSLDTTKNIKINNSRIFNNYSAQIYSGGTASSGRYYGKNIIYGNNLGSSIFTTGNATPSLGWTTGSISTANLGFSCNFTTWNIDGTGNVLYWSVLDCNLSGTDNYGRGGIPIVKYLYGNNMTGNQYVLRQIQPVIYSSSTGASGGLLSAMPFHGHRFIGEYDDPTVSNLSTYPFGYYTERDLNPPLGFYTGETPPQGYNVASSGYFSVRAYLYEPNLRILQRQDPISNSSVVTYNLYDDSLLFMSNFDNSVAIGDITTGFIKDVSLYKNFGIYSGVGGWISGGKYGGAYRFNGGNDAMTIKGDINTSGDSTIAFWINYSGAQSATYPTLFNRRPQPSLGGTGFRWTYTNGLSTNVYRQYADATNHYTMSRFNAIDTGTRTHLVFVYDNTAKTIALYKNGTILGSPHYLSATTYPTNFGNIYFGSYQNNGSTYALQGSLDEPRIYNRALNAGEVNLLYRSNLWAAADHREYLVNYTGTLSWSNGTHYYGFYYLQDLHSNVVNNNIGQVTNSIYNCTGSLINRDNSNYITGGFRNQNPGFCDIVLALYGTGTAGADPTAYTNYRNSPTYPRTGDNCNYQNMNIVYLTGGVDKLPDILPAYTIYLLSSGTYIQTDQNSDNIGTSVSKCTAIIGMTGTIKLYTTGQIDSLITANGGNMIFDNLQLDGTGNGIGGAHGYDAIGIKNMGYHHTLNNILAKNLSRNSAIYFTYSQYMKAENSTIFNSEVGMQIDSNVYNIIIQSGNIYNNNIDGIIGNGTTIVYSGLNIYNNHLGFGCGGSGNLINNIQIYSNDGGGLNLNGTNNTVNNAQIFLNSIYGIYMYYVNYSTVSNAQIYSNSGAGILFGNTTNGNVFNNIQSFNNSYGVDTDNDGNTKSNTTINNSQFYNNQNDGIRLYRNVNFVLNNSHVYNNSHYGIYFADTNNNSGIFNNVFTYNNAGYGIKSDGGTHKFYGKLTMFSNTLGGMYLSSITAGSSSTYNYLGRTGGISDTTPCMSCGRATNPELPGPSRQFLMDSITAYPKCNLKGVNTSWTATGLLNYMYGVNITGQKLPVFRSGTALTGASLTYSGSKKVAEINNIGNYTNLQCTCAGYSYSWNNDNFLSSGFWNTTPLTGYCDIIAALYGQSTTGADRTAYTNYRSNNWSGQCNVENMEVIVTGKIYSNILPTNTIYVVTGIVSTGNSIINTRNCSAVVSNQLTGTTFFTTGQLSIYGLFYDNNYNFNIWDNLRINGTGGGPVPSHTANSAGIYIYNGANNTINNTQVYNHLNYGIYTENSGYTTINNSQVYNNSNGIYIKNGINNVINNVQSYNGTTTSSYGIMLNASAYNTINNTQTYNNGGDGILLRSGSQHNIINNVQSYNNGAQGIVISMTGDRNELNNVRTYNNWYGGIYIVGSTGTKYFGTIRSFNNTTYGWLDITASPFTTGYNSAHPGFGRITGSISTGIMSRDYITNPENNSMSTGNLSGYYLLPWDKTGVNLGSFFSSYFNKTTYAYSYGSGILTQIQPVYYTGTTLQTGGNFSGTQYIGSNVIKVTGDLVGLPSTTMTTTFTVTGLSSNGLINKYYLFGNILSTPNATINTPLSITFSAGAGIKNIITQLMSGNTYFATHFQKQTEVQNISCLPTWDNSNFIDATFRASSPTSGNIICAIYGSGGYGGAADKTAYTRIWTGYDQSDCIDNNMTVDYTTNPFGGGTLNPYTIYVVTGGTYNLTTTLSLPTCTAIISQGDVSITGTNSNSYLNITYPYDVLDNLIYDGTNTSMYSVFIYLDSNSTIHSMNIYNTVNVGIDIFSNSNYNLIDSTTVHNGWDGVDIINGSYNTLHDVTTYGNSFYGIHLYSNANHNTLDGVQSYDNQYYGISLEYLSTDNLINNSYVFNNGLAGPCAGIILDTSDNNTINNTQVYNNEGDGIRLYTAMQTSINNALIYNNGIDGLYIDTSDHGILNNVAIMNNRNDGIYGVSPSVGRQISNIRTYNNNNYGYDRGDNMTYYGDNHFVDNGAANFNYFNFNQGHYSDHPTRGRTDGYAYDDGSYFGVSSMLNLTWDYFVNPEDANNNYLLPWADDFTTIRGYAVISNIDSVRYSFGSGIALQARPIRYDSSLSSWNYAGIAYDSTQYIGSNTTEYAGGLTTPGSITWNGFNIMGLGTTPDVTNYDLYGQDLAGPYTGSTTINTTLPIMFNTGATPGNMKIVTQIYSSSNFATHFETDMTRTDPCLPGRNNDNFVDNTFWAASPTDDNIICAFYGNGGADQTAYTKDRPGYDFNACILAGMTVDHTSGGIPFLPARGHAGYTIYVIPGGTYPMGIRTPLDIPYCTTFTTDTSVGSIEINSPSTPGDYLEFNSSSMYSIIDSLMIDGGNTTNYGIHYDNASNTTIHNMRIVQSNVGVELENNSNNNLIDQTEIFNSLNQGIWIRSSNYTIINNSITRNNSREGILISDNSNNITISSGTIYNNRTYGIDIDNSTFNLIDSSTIVNNGFNGILFNNSDYNTINNSQIYYCPTDAVVLSTSNYTTINNSLIYANDGYGITSNSFNRILNNVQIANNYNGGIRDNGPGSDTMANVRIFGNNGYGYDIGSNVSIYDDVYVLGNYTNFGSLSISMPGTQPALGRNIGTLYDDGTFGTSSPITLTRDYFANPYDGNYGLYCRPNRDAASFGIASYGTMGGRCPGTFGGGPYTTSYGSGILLQRQPVMQNGGIITGLVYDNTKYIGSNTIKYNGYLNIGNGSIPMTTYYYSGFSLIGGGNVSDTPVYNLFGYNPNSLSQDYGGLSLNIPTIVSFANNTPGTKKIVTQIVSSNNDMTHFQSDVILASGTVNCMTGWNNDNFITGGFWSNNPTSGNIICALYGSGPGDTTAYTQFWNPGAWNTTQCYGPAINVVYTGRLSVPASYMVSNTIYVVTGTISTGGTTINTDNCNVVISNQATGTTFYSTTFLSNGIFNVQGRAFDIFDNIAINGTGGGPVPSHGLNNYNLVIQYTHDNTINNSKFYNAGDGIDIRSSINNTVNNVQTYNNGYYGVNLFSNTQNNTFNDLQIYNNGLDGILVYNNSIMNVINNSQIYNNNRYGIWFAYSSNWNVLNNMQIFNNPYGINSLQSSDNALNNVQIYNNYVGINLDSDPSPMSYYGTLKLFNNRNGNTGGAGSPITGYASNFPASKFVTGSIITTGTMSWDYVTNPLNTDSNYLVSWTGSWTGIAYLKTGYVNTTTNGYSYGSGILSQVQPVYYNVTNILISGGKLNMFNTGNYIGSNTAKITGDVLGIPTTTLTSGLTVMGMTNFTSLVNKYSVFGNIIANIIGQNINTYTGIVLSSGLTTNRIITQIYSGNSYFATHFERDTILTGIIDCMSGRNNDNFITGAFRNNSPTPGNIICALYGSGAGDPTAYTQFRTGWNTTQCNGANMNVIYTGNLSATTLSPNTIYVVTNTVSTGSTNITTDNCDAIISNQATGTTFYSTTQLTNGMFYNYGKKYDIWDNIAINGTGGGPVPSHNSNDYGIFLTTFTLDNTINNVQSYNNTCGIFLWMISNYTLLNNIIVYNNTDAAGIMLQTSSQNNVLNNIQTYNNKHGIILYSSNNNTINNIQAYNSLYYGVWLQLSDYNTINNIQAYNNQQYGINIDSSSGNNINNSRTYNNTNYGIGINGSGNKYYGTINSFNNATNIAGTFTTGNASDYPGFGRTTGNIISGTMSRDYVTNPISTSSNYLVSWTGNWTDILGQQNNYLNNSLITNGYSYGSGILTQIQPVYYTGTILKTGGKLNIFNTGNYIGSTTARITGNIQGISTTTLTSGLVVTGMTNFTSLVNKYSVFGNIIANKIGQSINNYTGIQLSAGIGNKRVIAQLYSGTSYFATHFETDTALIGVLSCMTGWNNDNFITGGFRNNSPTSGNIICALYGSGIGDPTAYTQFRTGWNTTQCSGANMNVIYTGNLSATTLTPNTIYVVTGSVSTGNATINTDNCDTIISNQATGTTFYTTQYLSNDINISGKNYNIVDDININGTGGGIVPSHSGNDYGLYLYSSSNNTINNIKSYNNNLGGIYLYGGSIQNYNLINNSQSYNNGGYGIAVIGGMNSIINNFQAYDNYTYGIYIFIVTSYITINNSQSYNNGSDGIYMYNGSNSGTINNSQFYNNGRHGIDINTSASNYVLNNIQAYNNSGYGILPQAATNTKYYGNIKAFNNILGDISNVSYLTTGNAGDYPGFGRTTGNIISGTMSRDYVTNPISTSSNYLVSWTGNWTDILGQQNNYLNNSLITNGYSYGSGILTQIQPVYYTGTILKTGGILNIFSTGNYIGSTTAKVTGDLQGLTNITTLTIPITGISSNTFVNQYSVFGNIIANRIGQSINNFTGITLSTGLMTNRIVTQLYSGNSYFATHFERDVSWTTPIIYFTGTTPASGATLTGNNFAPQIETIVSGMNIFTYNFSGITYSYYDSGLVLMLNFDNITALGEVSGSIVKDVSLNGYTGTGYNGLTRSGGNGGNNMRGGSYIFTSGTYISFGTAVNLDYTSFTVALRTKGSNTSPTHPTNLIGKGDRNYSNDRFLGYKVGTTLSFVYGTGRQAGPSYPISSFNMTGRNYIVGVADATTQKLYVNGVLVSSVNTNHASVTDTTHELQIGKNYNNQYFSGQIDEVRIRNRALSSGEIQQMRRSNFQKFDVDKWRLTDDRQCMISNTGYIYTGYVANVALNATTGRINNINIANRNPTAPTGYSLGSTGFSNSIVSLSGQFTGFYTVEDRKGTSGRYTTFQLPMRLTGLTYSSNYIDRTNIFFMATGLNVIAGNGNSSIYVTGTLGTYQTGNTPKTYMVRDTVTTPQYSCPSGIYGNKPFIRVDIPANTTPDTYSGILNMILYE